MTWDIGPLCFCLVSLLTHQTLHSRFQEAFNLLVCSLAVLEIRMLLFFMGPSFPQTRVFFKDYPFFFPPSQLPVLISWNQWTVSQKLLAESKGHTGVVSSMTF
jgi:hypothetical protein